MSTRISFIHCMIVAIFGMHISVMIKYCFTLRVQLLVLIMQLLCHSMLFVIFDMLELDQGIPEFIYALSELIHDMLLSFNGWLLDIQLMLRVIHGMLLVSNRMLLVILNIVRPVHNTNRKDRTRACR